MPNPPFVGSYGRIRLSPLQEAVAKSNGATSITGGSSNLTSQGLTNQTQYVDPATGSIVTPDEINDAYAKAQAGDKDALDWLNTLGIGAGIAGGAAGGYLLYKSMRNGRRPQQMTPDGQIPTETRSTAVVPTKRNPDLYIDLPETEYKTVDDYLPKRPVKVIAAPTQPTINNGQPSQYITQQAGNNYPVGRTNQQKEEDYSYMQKAFQDARAAKAGTNAAKERAYKFNQILKSMGRIF